MLGFQLVLPADLLHLITEWDSDVVTVHVGPRGMPLNLYGQVAQLFLPVRPAGPGHSSGAFQGSPCLLCIKLVQERVTAAASSPLL